MEKVGIRSAKGRAEFFGAMICISGALIFTFWKGHLFDGFVKRPLIMVHGKSVGDETAQGKQDWIKGSVLILTSYVAFSAWLVLQVIKQSLLLSFALGD